MQLSVASFAESSSIARQYMTIHQQSCNCVRKRSRVSVAGSTGLSTCSVALNGQAKQVLSP